MPDSLPPTVTIATEPYRTPSGGRIDRAKPISFTFDGRAYTGRAGDTLASALLANGVHLMGRSFKYHRPRGVMTAGSDEPNALVTVSRDTGRTAPNLRATQIELYDGLTAISQNRYPSLAFDVGGINDRFSALFPAGFYYKTFMWPRSFWDRVYEPVIRSAAGLGKVPTAPDPDRYLQRNAHCEVLIIGAGAAGLTAALAAAASGLRVILCDEQAEMGGSLLADTNSLIAGKPAQVWLAETLAELASFPNVTLLPRTTGFGYYPHNHVGLVERVSDHLANPNESQPRERMWQVRAREVVIATGALERPLTFPENDRPGIMLADAATTYVNRYGAVPGRRAVIATTNDNGYRAALTLAEAGVEIAVIADLRHAPAGDWYESALKAGLPIAAGKTIAGTSGKLRVDGASIASVGADGTVWQTQDVACDLLLMAGGWTPTLHLYSQSLSKLRWDEALQAYVPGAVAPSQALRAAGAANGAYGLDAALAEGFKAGQEAALAAGGPAVTTRQFVTVCAAADASTFLGALPHNRDASRVRAFVDFQNDSTAKDLKLAVREGFRSVEHAKRYTTTGMATDQGKTSNMPMLGVMAQARGVSVPEVGFTTFRPPFTPTTFGNFAGAARGDLFDPVRRTAIHPWAEAKGAVFEDVGMWKRAHYFPKSDEDMHAAVARECLAVRKTVGLFDASTLGKIEVVGPDAAEFMNRMYINPWTKLGVGRCRYGVMLREDGFVLDDGVVGRIAADRFHVTTTTGGAASVLNMMEDYLQTEWSDLNVWLTSITEEWSVIAVQGPKARAVLAPLVEGIDLSPAAFPHMAVVEGRICGVKTRLFRVSFTGELGFEVNVPAAHGRAVWEAIWAEGRKHDMVPYGTETMHVLRAEKGFIIVGQETDGTATPDDAGLAWAVGKAKKDFVGKRSLARPAMTDPKRKQLVGLLSVDGRTVLEEGMQIVADPRQPVPMTVLGHVTSAYRSAVLDHPIALAMLEAGRSRHGETLHVPMAKGGAIAVKVVPPVFYDPEGARLDVV
ncbi:MAG TPA: sarcosine oxidase subunit alpha family protein [Acidisoma sp.]|uniref:sarcosine oxidase subunit alpha family protein n=1 Tax=Acidisoma sp. TaxID=1872115 RepID=UPI002CB4E0F5|nr:sarcosine oxidase subunit alpha family protein [Acidisoma sp.]HTI03124.1 sarcosine oxidase subunit alpha family protein [Acidisoma sp.]